MNLEAYRQRLLEKETEIMARMKYFSRWRLERQELGRDGGS